MLRWISRIVEKPFETAGTFILLALRVDSYLRHFFILFLFSGFKMLKLEEFTGKPTKSLIFN
jgi:hypothetical protein